MRICVIGAAALWLAAVPASAQQHRDVLGPLTLVPAKVMCTDRPVIERPIPRLTIFGPHSIDQRFSFSTGATVVIKRYADDGIAPGRRYIASRVEGIMPRPGEGFGKLHFTGVVTITAADEVNALAQVEFACDSMEMGDYLEPYSETLLPGGASDITIEPDFSDRANVLFGVDGREANAGGDLVSIDRGTLHGVIPGHRYAIYRDKKNGMPLIYIAEAVVITTEELTSKVMITKAIDGVALGDVAVPRRQQP